MKAIVCRRYGSPETLRLEEVATPVPTDDQALVKICATSVNAADLEMLRGTAGTRFSGLFRPGYPILGTDVAGRIEAVGRNVSGYQPGDQVWGDLSFPQGYSTFAQYVCIHTSALRRKPPAMSYEQAAAIPTSAVVALQNLTGKKSISGGDRVLINGAGGGVGSFALQLAKHYGAEVTAVDTSHKMDFLRSLGADHVIDYTSDNFVAVARREPAEKYDLILDVVVRRWFPAYARALRPEGVCVMTGGLLGRVFVNMALGARLPGHRKVGLVMWKPNHQPDLDLLAELFQSGKIVPAIDRTYPLEEVPEAMRRLEAGESHGKIVITVE